jgi:hypothetical protein
MPSNAEGPGSREPSANRPTDVPAGGRLKEMPPFGEPDATYPPQSAPRALNGSVCEDDPHGLYLPVDKPGF